MSLGSLPVELLITLGSFCDYTQLASLAGANHTFHVIFNPILYKRNAADVPEESCLHWAVEHDLLSTLKLAIAYGADIDNTVAQDRSWLLDERRFDHDVVYGSPLHLAILKKRPEMVRWLLDNNASLDVPSYRLCSCSISHVPSPWYPLHFAICHGNDEILCLLLEYGAFYSAKDVIGLSCAVKSGVLPAVEILTQLNNFDPNYRDSLHMTPLHWIYKCAKLESVVAITERLIQGSVPVDVRDINGRTALFYLAVNHMLEPATILLLHGADPTLTHDGVLNEGERGADILDCCFEHDGERKIQIAREVDPSKAEAMIERRLEFAKLAIKCGVDVNRCFCQGPAPFARPLFWALAGTHDVRCVQLILDAGADISSAIVERCHTESESLLRCFFDLSSEEPESYPWIWGSFETDLKRQKESVCLLLEKGARIDAAGDEYSALSKACEHERKNGALTLLVENATCRNTELGHVAKLRERYKADELIYKLLNGFYDHLEAEMRTGEQETNSPMA